MKKQNEELKNQINTSLQYSFIKNFEPAQIKSHKQSLSSLNLLRFS